MTEDDQPPSPIVGRKKGKGSQRSKSHLKRPKSNRRRTGDGISRSDQALREPGTSPQKVVTQASNSAGERHAGGGKAAAPSSGQFNKAHQFADLGRDLAKAPWAFDPRNPQRPFWARPVGAVMRVILRRPKRLLADRCVGLAKGRFASNGQARVFLAALADALDPKPFRKKWLAFRLYENGLVGRAGSVLRKLDGQISYSKADCQVLDAIKNDLDRRKPRTGHQEAGQMEDKEKA